MREGRPPGWSSYVSVEDADAAIAAVRANGGSVAVEPMDVLDIGRLAFFVDPTGAICGVWQPTTFPHTGLPTSRSSTPTPRPSGCRTVAARCAFGPADIPVGRFAMAADPWGARSA